ncbi:uncharacterized protein LOC104584626 [Brachypodium distachyon]|uniref:uncharacterized protein LOC104584626 n=1 Tax=Brachypodium distachyon TaxID=15368 RepID=UPI000D0E17D5|nr:uncharacterized protein LOC104584626 [Brachypodium distachyon]|eukprot:XP_024319332.1 uncharacterized protein LOC104584626 [Brachypodium distachyon]
MAKETETKEIVALKKIRMDNEREDLTATCTKGAFTWSLSTWWREENWSVRSTSSLWVDFGFPICSGLCKMVTSAKIIFLALSKPWLCLIGRVRFDPAIQSRNHTGISMVQHIN